MKILLILPMDNIYYYKGFMRNSLGYAPLTLLTLAALVPKELNAQIKIVDEGVQKPSYDKDHYDVVGITCTASSSPRAYYLAEYFRNKGSFVVLGGAHPTLMPQEAERHADTIIIGPGEISWPQLLKDYVENNPKKIYRHDNDKIGFLSMPIPRRDLQPKNLYMPVPTIIANRGCRNNCNFCTISCIYGSQSLCRPINEVIEEIKFLRKRKILFLDPSPTSDREYAKQLYKALIPLKIKWMGLSTLSVVYDQELFDLMVKSGCTGILIGFETFNQANNDMSHKKFNDVKKYKEVIDVFHQHKISILGHFILGFDGDTKESIIKMMDTIDELGIDLPRYTILTPFPGTELYNQMEEDGRIITDDMSLYDTEHVVFKPKNMSPEELHELYLKIKKETYSYKRIIKRSSAAPGNRMLALAANVGFRFLQNNNVFLALLTNLSLKIHSSIVK